MADQEPQFHQDVMIDPTPMPDHIPKVKEIGSTSAPLFSAAYFIGARCRPYGDDFMQCKTEAYGKGETECLKEGRKVTRCAQGVLQDINTHCLEEWRAHWKCLERNNHQLWDCRPAERPFNKCVFDKIGLEKTIPDYREGQTPIHLREKQIYARHSPRGPEHMEWLKMPFGTLARKWSGLNWEEMNKVGKEPLARKAEAKRQRKEMREETKQERQAVSS